MWKPKVMLEYEIAVAFAAIKEILLRAKPIAEIVGRKAKEADLLSDLNACIRLANGKGKVFPWIRKEKDGRLSCGFYSYPCMRDALEHMTHAKIDPMLRHVFLGLLYGYRPDAIQKFVTKQKRPRKPRRGLKTA